MFQIILRHENSEPPITQLGVQFLQVFSAFQACTMSRYFGLLIGNGVAYFLMSCACHNLWIWGDCVYVSCSCSKYIWNNYNYSIINAFYFLLAKCGYEDLRYLKLLSIFSKSLLQYLHFSSLHNFIIIKEWTWRF